ncbi:unnamed protein product [Didymodactylos carnosus]|nr:unnamed protein product [Didymodactylos carnosus]CAF4268229.1 unnamed protein product [Didymodactylos carnosus]
MRSANDINLSQLKSPRSSRSPKRWPRRIEPIGGSKSQQPSTARTSNINIPERKPVRLAQTKSRHPPSSLAQPSRKVTPKVFIYNPPLL